VSANVTRKISRREWLAVIALLLIAFALRTIDLTHVPPGLHNDEIAFAEIAETVTQGRLAIFFPENIGNEGLAYYFAAPFMDVLGRNVLALRLPAAFISLVAACAIWALTRRLFGAVAALTALASFAVVFWTVAFGRIALHVVMMVPLATLAAYGVWRAQAAQGRQVKVWWVLCGLCLGLAIDTYTAARILPFILIAFGFYILIVHRADWRRWWSGIAMALAAAVVVALPLFITLAQNPAEDQLGFFDIDRPLRELAQGDLQPVIETSLRTLGMFAFFGDPLPYYDVPDRPILEPIGAVLLLAGLVIALRRWRKPKYMFVTAWFFISLLPGMLSQPAPNYTRTLGVQTVLFTALGLAVAEIVQRFHRRSIYAGLAVLFIGNLIWTTHDYFTVWPSIDTVRFWHQSGLKAVADQLAADPDTSPVAICLPDHLIDEREPWWIPAWRHMRWLLARTDLSLRYYNCADTSVLIDGPARYAFPDAADEATLEQFPIYTQFLKAASANRVELPDRLGEIIRTSGSVWQPPGTLVKTASFAPEASGSPVQAPITFAGQAEFVGYTLSASSASPGQIITLTTYWSVLGQLPPQLSQFTHVLDAQGDIVTQEDRLMITTQSLRAGDVVAQVHRLTLPGDAKRGTYRVAIGLYTQPDGKRLPIFANEQPRGDRLFLQSIEVK
jgi:hypothetical protein